MKEHLKKYIDQSGTPEVRGLRILLEYFYATEIFKKITSSQSRIISVFGSARTQPHSPEYRIAHRVGWLLYQMGFAVVTGASRGIMQAANQGVADAIAADLLKGRRKGPSEEEIRHSQAYRRILERHSVGLSISLPMELESNPFVGVGATFHYFMVRKFFFGSLSSGFIACEGGWGTRDELFEILTLVQTGKAPLMPIIYLSPDPSHMARDIRHALKKGYISPADTHLIHLVRTPEEAVREIGRFYRNVNRILYERDQSVRIQLKSSPTQERKKSFERLLEKDGDERLVALDLEWKKKEVILHQYSPNSYGSLRCAIDLLNQPLR